MTPGSAVFWIYLAAYGNLAGIPALVLGVIARFTTRPFDTPRRLRVFSGLLAIVALLGVVASALSYNLALDAGAFAYLRASSLVAPFLGGVVIFIWASGFPLRRNLPRRR